MRVNLHRRKAKALAPATVTVTESSLTIIVPDVVGKNASHTGGRGGLRHVSAATKALRASVAAGIAGLHVSAMFARLLRGQDPGPLLRHGAWRLEVIGVWPTEHHDVGFPAPMGDADAAIPQALDALMSAGVLDDDGRVVEVRAWNLYRRGVRATVIRLTRVDLVERDAAIAHLLDLVPAAVERPAKAAHSRRKVKT